MQLNLLKSYQKVLFTECDEIIFPNPDKYDGLDDYISQFHKHTIRCYGHNMIHQRDKESADFDLSKPVLEQRHFWYHTFYGNLAFIELIIPLRKSITTYTYCIFIVWIITCLIKTLARRKLNWSQFDIRAGKGANNRYTEEELNNWWNVKLVIRLLVNLLKFQINLKV